MPRPVSFGTNAFTGLNTKLAPHLLQDTELQDAINCKYEDDGSVRPLTNNLDLYTHIGGQFVSAIGLAHLKYAGADHHIYKPTFPTYQDGVALAAISFNSNHVRFLSDGTRVFSFDSSESSVSNGTYVRDLGPVVSPNPDAEDGKARIRAPWIISAATNDATGAVLTLLYGPHELVTGDTVYLKSFGGGTWATANDAEYAVTVVDPTNVKLDDLDSSGLGTYLGNSGSMYENPMMVTGDARYAAQVVLEFPDNTEVTSELTEIYTLAATESEETATIGAITLEPQHGMDIKLVYGDLKTALENYTTEDNQVNILVRIYRTKADGASFYLVHEEDAGLISDLLAADEVDIYDTVKDRELGALYLYEIGQRAAAPVGDLATFAGQRLYIAADRRLYWSQVASYDYFPGVNGITVTDDITAIGNIDNKIVIFGRDAIWIYVPDELLGNLMTTHSPVGTKYPDSVRVTDEGVYFARDDGLWVFDGVTSHRVNEAVSSDWEAISGTWAGDLITGRILYSTNSGAMTAERGMSGVMWTKLDVDDTPGLVVRSLDSDKLYGLTVLDDGSGVNLVEMFGGTTEETMTVQTKNYGGGQVFKGWANHMDIDPQGNTVIVTVETSSGDSHTYTITGSSRRQYRDLLPRDMRGEYWNVKVVGKCRWYGHRTEVMR
jgi:hypothetical protein